MPSPSEPGLKGRSDVCTCVGTVVTHVIRLLVLAGPAGEVAMLCDPAADQLSCETSIRDINAQIEPTQYLRRPSNPDVGKVLYFFLSTYRRATGPTSSYCLSRRHRLKGSVRPMQSASCCESSRAPDGTAASRYPGWGSRGMTLKKKIKKRGVHDVPCIIFKEPEAFRLSRKNGLEETSSTVPLSFCAFLCVFASENSI